MKRQEYEQELPREQTILHDAERCGPTARETARHRWRFTAVLLASLLLAVAQPLTAGLFGERGSFEVFFSLLIVAVLVLVFEEREHRRTAISLGLAAFLGLWASHALGGWASRMFLVAADLLAACFFCLRFVRHSPCDPRKTGLGWRDFWRRLRLPALGNYLEPRVPRGGDRCSGVV